MKTPEKEARAAFTRRVIATAFWFVALSLAFNALLGDMGLVQGFRQRRGLARLQEEVARLRSDNGRLTDDIAALRNDPYRIEAIAREELGLARPGEILFLFQESPAPLTPEPEADGGEKGAAR